jgi:glutaredoxin
VRNDGPAAFCEPPQKEISMRETSIRARLAVIVALGVAAIVSTQTAAQQMYRWVDKDGKVHYTQNPPPRDAAKSVQQRRLNPSGPVEDSTEMPYAIRQAVINFPVTLFTVPDCTRGCNDARELLNKRGIPHLEISVSDNASKDMLRTLTGDSQVPSMLVGKTVEKGFEEGSFNNALDAAGYPRTSLFVGKPPALPSPKPRAKPAASAPVAPPQPATEGTAQPTDASQAPPAR